MGLNDEMAFKKRRREKATSTISIHDHPWVLQLRRRWCEFMEPKQQATTDLSGLSNRAVVIKTKYGSVFINMIAFSRTVMLININC